VSVNQAMPALSDSPAAGDRPVGASWVLFAQIAVLAALGGIIFRPALEYMVHKWGHDGNWSHGWLVPLFCLYFLGTRRQALAAQPRRINLLGLVLMVLALAGYYLAFAYRYAYPARLMIVPFLMGLVLFLCGWRISRIAWFPITYLLLAIPLPAWAYFKLTLPLRRIASVVAGALLGLLPDVYTKVEGVVIEYEHAGLASQLNVEEACSGMRLMMAFIALGVAVAYLGDRPMWHRIVLVACCVPIAVFCNMIRVFVTGVLHVYGYTELSQGSAHQLLGLAMLPIALGLFTFAGYVLNNLFVEGSDAEATAAD
jgi:exosortase